MDWTLIAIALLAVCVVLLVLVLQQLSRSSADVDDRLGELRRVVDDHLTGSLTSQQEVLRDQQQAVSRQLAETNVRLEEIRSTLSTRLVQLQQDNAAQLERMRLTVDERLQETLDARIAKSFELVNSQLSEVGRGLGEMQSLARDVGGLKKILSNVKTRGIVGEIQLGAILDEILAPAQYEENVEVVPGSKKRVEFAVRMPGTEGETVWLPIDSKFPGDAYEHLRDAQQTGDTDAVDAAWKELEGRIVSEAKEISEKYVSPPATTAFGILFLPFEGLYAEVVNRRGLLERLQRSYHVNVAGPSTMAALLNSLQMGFQTVAIQERADEISRVLAAVKTEFGNYQSMLEKAQRQIGTVSRTIDDLVGTRARAMERRLRSVTELDSAEEAEEVLGIGDGEEPDAGGPAVGV